MPTFSDDEESKNNSGSGPTKEKVKTRGSHSSINVTSVTGNPNVATVTTLTADTLTAAAQGVNVCPLRSPQFCRNILLTLIIIWRTLVLLIII